MTKLREIAHSRTGDKGNTSNISVIAYDEKHYPLLLAQVTSARVKALFAGVVEGEVVRYELPNIAALNFVMSGALGGGVTRSLALDAHGKSLSSALLDLDIDDDIHSRHARACPGIHVLVLTRRDGRDKPGHDGERCTMKNAPTLAALADDLAGGRTSARKLVDACLAKIADTSGEGARAFIHVDAEAAIEAAEAMDRLREIKAAPSRFAGIPVSIKDLFDIRGQVTRAGSRALDEFAAGGGRRARGGAAAPGRFRGDRPHQHDRVRLFRDRHQSALRHAEGRLAAQRRPCARRIVVGRGGIGRRRHGAWRARHRHRRLLPDSGGL